MEEYVLKVAHTNPEVADRAVNTLGSKLGSKLVRIDDLLSVQNGIFCGHLLHWINERQTQAEGHLLASAMKMMKLSSESRIGRKSLRDFGAVEFLNAYHRYAPGPIQDLISDVLNQLVSSGDMDETVRSESVLEISLGSNASETLGPTYLKTEKFAATFEPRSLVSEASKTKLYTVSKADPDAHPRVDEHSEYPPVLLNEADEKVLFDLTVSLKFGDTEQAIEALEQVIRGVFQDFPIDSLLQRADLVRSIAGLAARAGEKQALLVSEKCVQTLELFLKKICQYDTAIRLSESRPAQCLPRKLLVAAEFADMSHPSLSLEAWESGTPGNTLSTSGALELLLTSIPLHEPKTLGVCKLLWKEAEPFLEKLAKHPLAIQLIVKQFSSALETIDSLGSETNLFLYRLTLAQMLVPLIKSIPVDALSNYIPSNSTAGKCLTEFMIFRTPPEDDLLAYLQELDPEGIKDYSLAIECVQALAKSQKVKESLRLTNGLPITSVAMYYNTLTVFQGLLPALEFDDSLSLAPAVIDLNCYSLIISQDSHLDARVGDAQDLLLALLTCPLPQVSHSAHVAVLTALQDSAELGGIGRGSKRNLLTAEVFLTRNFLVHWICISDFAQRFDVLLSLVQLKGGKDIQEFLSFLQGASAHDAKAATVLHLVMSEVTDDSEVFWKAVRDLFALDVLKRKAANHLLLSLRNVKQLAVDVQRGEFDLGNPREQDDYMGKLEEKGDLDFMEIPSDPADIQDLSKLLPFLQSQAIEPTLKNSVLEQIITFLLAGIPHLKTDLINPLIVTCVDLLSLDTAGNAPVINRKLVSKSLQILCILPCNYPALAKKVYEVSIEVVIQVAHMTSSMYSPIRYYAYYLLFIYGFSIEIPRNKTELTSRVVASVEETKTKPKGRLTGIPIYDSIGKGFKCPFPVLSLRLQYDPSQCSHLLVWKHLPSSARVHAYVRDEFSFDFHPALELNQLGAAVARAETHGQILDAVDEWVNLVLLAPNVVVLGELLEVDSAFFTGILSILRVPPTNRSEDALVSSLVSRLTTVAKSAKPHVGKAPVFDFYVQVGELLQKSLLPLLIEASTLEARGSLICSVIELMNCLLPLHETRLESGELKTIKVLSKFQLEPSALAETSLLHVLSRISELCDSLPVLSCILESLYRILTCQSVTLALDLASSPASQEALSEVLKTCISHVTPYLIPGSFVHKGCLKRLMHVCVLVPELVSTDGFAWCIKLTRDREAEVRGLAWTLLRRLLPRTINAHPSLVEESLVVGFGEPDTYGTKTHAIAFLAEVANTFAERETGAPETQHFISTLYQQGVISHIKALLYENAGPGPGYFAALITLLNGLLVLDTPKVIAMCNQLDLWDGIMRLLRPAALTERSSNEKRAPFKSVPVQESETELIAITLLFNFVSQAMTRDAQTCDFLLESTHILSYALQWLNDLTDQFQSGHEGTHSNVLLATLTCVHCGLYIGKGRGARAVKEEVNYSVIADLLDKVNGSEVRIAVARVLTCLLPISDPGADGERLILHQIGTFKTALERNETADLRDAIGSLSSLFFYSEAAKRVALATGFDKDIAEYIARISASIHQEEIARSRPKYLKAQSGGSQDQADLLQALLIVKTWTAGPTDVKAVLAVKNDGLGAIYQVFFSLWSLATRFPKLLEALLQTISTAIAECDEAKKACAMLQENKQSILSLMIEFTCKPALVSEDMYLLALVVIGNIAANKEARQLLIKSKFAFGLAQRLVKVWNECKDPTVLPPKTLGTVSFLSTFSFYIPGLIDVLMEVLERYENNVASIDLVQDVLLLVRNLGFQQATKPHIFTKPMALPLVLSLASSPQEKPKVRKLAAAALWSVLYGNMKVKGILSRTEALENLRSLYMELSRDIESAQRTAGKDSSDALSDLKETALALDSIIKICTSC